MAPSKKTKPAKVYTLKVTLDRSKPPIWRRLQVLSSMTLNELHHVIQIAMGWENDHLHEFEIKGQRFAAKAPYSNPFDEPSDDDFDDDGCPGEDAVRLGDVLTRKKQKFSYLYDFGDSWEHSILVEAIDDAGEGDAYPICLDGVGACPPEDCGGLGGYYQMLKVLKKPKHKQYEEYREWIGEGFDPKAFDLEIVKKGLSQFAD